MQLPLVQSDDAEFMLMQTRWKSILDPILKDASAAAQTTPGALPAGSLLPYAGGTVPSGYLLCDGRELPSKTYPALAAALGTTWGTPASSANFTLPDGRGRSLIGAGQGTSLTNRVLGTTGGEETHVLLTAEMPIHTHNTVKTLNGATLNGADTTYNLAARSDGGGTAISNPLTASTGGDGAHNNMQPWFAANWIVKI